MRRLHTAEGATCYLDDSDPTVPLLVTVLDDDEPDATRVLELETEYLLTHELEIPGVRRAVKRGLVEGRQALYSSWFSGSTLEEAFAGTSPPIERVLELAARVADVVAALHAQRLMHGRLDPRAFRIDTTWRHVELSGLGAATRLDVDVPDEDSSIMHLARGPYISPEQTGRMNRPVDWRTDLYSLGAIFYFMLTGRPPVEATDPVDLTYRLIAVEPQPPHELAPQVPEAVSSIVLKLLAKNAEHRYQSADALSADLNECRQQWLAAGRVAQFPLAQHDLPIRFRLPPKLYGRDQQLETLRRALDDSATGESQLVLVAGSAGVGKTALVRELLRTLTVRRGRYVEGKFDQFQRQLPFAAFAQAFSAWVHDVLSESDQELDLLRGRIKEAVGDLGALVTRLVPDLELIVGPQPPVPEVLPSEAMHRFQYVLRRFSLSIADPRRPLVLFIDDLHWADPASLDLLTTLMTTRESRHLLVIGAYRDDEVGRAHAFQLCLDELERAGARQTRMRLEPLGPKAVNELVVDTLSSGSADVEPLTSFVWKQTQGNALFVRQLLRSLYDDGLIRFSNILGGWEWQLGATKTDEAPVDVLSLISTKTARLPVPTQKALIYGASLSSRFDATTLATLLDQTVTEVRQTLEPAVKEGLLVPQGVGHRYLELGLEVAQGQQASYAFPHDRIQQAVYSHVVADERAELHLAIGLKLLERRTDIRVASDLRSRAPHRAHAAGKEPSESEKSSDVGIFELCHQLNLGSSSIEDSAQRLRVAWINLKGALAAKQAAAYAGALEYLTQGIDLLGDDPWASSHELSLELHSEAAECAYLSAELDRMEYYAQQVLARGRTILEKSNSYLLLVDAYTSQNRLNDALRTGLEALDELGVHFPKNPKLPHILLGLGRTKLNLAGKDVPALARQHAMTDPFKLEAMLLLERMVPPAYMSGNPLFPLLVFAMVDLSVKYGNSPLSGFGYASFGITLSGVLGDIRSGTMFGKLGYETLEATRAEAFRAKVLFVLHVFIQHWTQHLADSIAPLLDAYRVGMEAGNLVGATWSAYYRLLWMYFSGRALAELEREAATYSAIFYQLEQHAAYRRNDMLRQVLLNLMAQTADPLVFSGETYKEEEIDGLAAKGDDATSRFFYHFNKEMLAYLFGKHGDAVAQGDAARPLLESVTGLPELTFWCFWDALARVAASEQASGPRARKLQSQARAHAKKLAKWGRFAPMNYAHKHDLLRAELARLEGKHDSASDHYDRAIEGAIAHGWVHEAALAQELAGRYYASRKNQELATFYLGRARNGWLEWGALAKVEALELEYQELLTATAAQTAWGPSSPKLGSATNIDLASVVKATAAISGEIVLERLAAKLLEVAVENAGAQHGALVLFDQGEGRIVARKTTPDQAVITGLSIPLDESAPVAVSVLHYVARSKRPLVADDAVKESRFALDPYVRKHGVLSVLCAPIIHQTDLIAAVYLDNTLVARAFTDERVELLSLLGGQIAISLENARLYGNLRQSLDRQVALTHAYSRFTPRAFLDLLGRESILDVELGDHRHGDMTVMFLDIRGYTGLSERLSARENFLFLNGFLRRMTPHIARCAGVVARFTGDGLMAFFPEHPDTAVSASLAMQNELRAYNVQRATRGRPEIQMGIGLHTGPLMIGVVGIKDRLETTLISDTVNTAARMEGLTKEFHVHIIASEATVSRLVNVDKGTLRCVGDVLVKGKSQATRVYDCFGADAPADKQLKRSSAKDFSEGLAALQAADFARARTAFRRVVTLHPKDGTARRYLDRADTQLARGESQSWSPVEVMDRK